MVAQRDTYVEEERLFLLSFADDTEEAPWMINTDFHTMIIHALYYPFKNYGADRCLNWYVSSDLPVLYTRPNGRTGQVAPDIMVAFAPDTPREAFDSRLEGFPPFVLEVVTKKSRTRDTGKLKKVELHRLLGAREYVIVDLIGVRTPPLRGYHRVADGSWHEWSVGPRGELRSGVLGLTLVPEGSLLRLEDPDGRRLPTAEEEHTELARLRAQISHSG